MILHYKGSFVVQNGCCAKKRSPHKHLHARSLRKRVIGIEPTTFSLGTPQALEPKRVNDDTTKACGLQVMRALRQIGPICGRSAV